MKNRKFRLLAIIILASLLLVTLSLTTACSKQEAAVSTIKIGMTVSLTGPMSTAETPHRDGALLAADWINSKGGITVNGKQYKIEYLVEDTQSTADGAVAAATKLVNSDKVQFLAGGMLPQLTIPIGQITEPAKVARSVFHMIGVPDELSPKTPYTFYGVPSTAIVSPEYDHLLQAYPNVKKIASLMPDDPPGLMFTQMCKDESTKRGLTLTDNEIYPFGTEDLYPVWTKILATNPDAVDLGGSPPGILGSELKQGRELGFKGPCFSNAPADLFVIGSIVGATGANDFFDSSFDLNGSDVPPMIKDIVKMWNDKYGTSTPITMDILSGFDGTWSMIQAIEKAQSVDPTVVAQTWEKMAKVETSCGTATMGGLKTYGINHVVVAPCPISRLNNGKVELANWFNPDIP